MKNVDKPKDKHYIDKNFILQSPVEIFPKNVEKKTKEIRIGNITLSSQETKYRDKGIEKRMNELPHTTYDRKMFYYFLKLIKSHKSKTVFKFSLFKLLKEISKSEKISSTQYHVVEKSLARWRCVEMTIDKYIEIDEKNKTKKVDFEVFKIVSGLKIYDDNTIKFELTKFFCDFVRSQKYLKQIDYEEIKQLTDKREGLTSQLFMFLSAWQGKTIVRTLEHLKEKLGVKMLYKEKPPALFVQSIDRACKRINKSTHIEVEFNPIKESVPTSKKPVYTKIEFTVSEQKDFLDDIDKIKSEIKEKVDFDVYNVFVASLDLLIRDAVNANYSTENLVNLIAYTARNRVQQDSMTMQKFGTITNPVGFMRKAIRDLEVFH